jgi:hypothetical protein
VSWWPNFTGEEGGSGGLLHGSRRVGGAATGGAWHRGMQGARGGDALACGREGVMQGRARAAVLAAAAGVRGLRQQGWH